MLLTGSPPTDLALSPNFIAENQPIGTPVGQFSTTDPDPGDISFAYSFLNGSGDNDNALFTIEGNQLKTKAVFDYEALGRHPTYSIVVRVTDPGGETLDKRLTVFVEDVNEPPGPVRFGSSSVAYVAENQPAGTAVGTLSATDPEGDTKLTYTLVAGPGGPDNAYFTIQGTQLKTQAAFDYETQSTYNLRVRVSDGSGAFADSTLSVSVVDVNEAPSAVSHSYSTLQNMQLSVGTPGLLDGAKDPEGTPPKAILVANSGPSHGVLSLRADGSFVYQPDANFVGTDQFKYQVSDGRLSSAAMTVTISVGYGFDPIVEAPTLVTGSNNLVLSRVGDNLVLISFANRQVLLNTPVTSLNSLTVLGVDSRADTLTIDASASGPDFLPQGMMFVGGNGSQADTLALRGSSGADTFAVGAGVAQINSLVIAFSGVEQVFIDGGGGDDTYQISDLPVNATISDSKGIDTLDFSAAASGVTIDLAKVSKAQKVLASAAGTLTLKGTIENVIGSESADWIKGNSSNNRIEGGDGDDTLYGEAGHDVLLGGAGDDRLDAGAGRNLLIGGLGADTLQGRSGEEILIGGTTLYDDDSLALADIMKEWTSARTFKKRCDNLSLRLVKGTTVLDDLTRDDLFGSSGSDWFFDFASDVAHDRGRNDR
jgi:Ca2+-binding RTX toxin-like protein